MRRDTSLSCEMGVYPWECALKSRRDCRARVRVDVACWRSCEEGG